MISRRGVALSACGSFLLACAGPPPVESSPPQIKLAVVQNGTGQSAEHVFCQDGKCPPRTPKIIALPAPKPGPAAQVPKKATYSVQFRWGWSRLDADGSREVEQVVAGLRALQNLKMIEISGRTDPTGSLRYNQRLALRRAETVKAALVLAGYSASEIQTRTKTPCCDGPLNGSAKVMQQLRRADIQITITTR